MNTVESLAQTHRHAAGMLVQGYDARSGFPITATSHTDFWPGDTERWVKGYLEIGRPEIAMSTMAAVARSVRHNDGVPHYMLGTRPIGKFDTKIIDRYVQKLSGNGLELSEAGEWVTTTYAPPVFALAAAALSETSLSLPSTMHKSMLARAHSSFTDARRDMRGLIRSHNPNELTNNSGTLAHRMKKEGAMIDPAINALYVKNTKALAAMWPEDTKTQQRFLDDADRTRVALDKLLEKEHAEGLFSLEATLAAARLGYMGMIRDEDLMNFFKGPDPDNKHPERTKPSFADTIEVARLTSGGFSESRAYLNRVLAALAFGPGAFTRYEGITPGINTIANRTFRRQVWLPTAAEAVRITEAMVK